MENFSNSVDAVVALHDNGFTNDFQLFGNDLLWIQEGVFVRAGEFAILEYYKIPPDGCDRDGTVVFGIVAPHYNIKGILLSHYNSYSAATPPVLLKKMNELNVYSTAQG